jgi:hypothetical protein
MSSHDIDNTDDRTTALLKQALSEEAAMVDASPGGLQQIQARTAEANGSNSSRRRRWMLVTPLGAGLAAAAVIFGIVVLNGGSNNAGDKTPAVSTPQQHQGVYDPNAPASQQFTVWYVGPDPANPQLKPRLFAETHTVTNPGSDPQIAAVRELLTSTPIDPDYRNPWGQSLDVTDITANSGVTTFNLADPDNDGVGALPANQTLRTLALQTLARTAGMDSGVFGLYFNGGGDDIGYSVQPLDAVRAFLTIDNIVDGQTLSNPVTVQVSGNTFEGNVVWQLLDANGDKVDEGYTTTSQGMWTQVPVELGDLSPGTYTFKAIEYSMEDGQTIQNLDDKTFTVE